MRKNYIDNLRTACILLLFPFHTAMIYNNWGEKFYVNGVAKLVPSLFVVIAYPWWMNLLFVLAGISSFYALQKRTAREYEKERIRKLLVPVLAGLVILIPPQTYIADMFHQGYEGNLFSHDLKYFTTLTDWSGTDGAFTPGHLWFMLYLYLISMVMVRFMVKYIKAKKKLPYEKINIVMLIGCFIIVLLCTPVLNLGKSIGESWACFALGFFVLSSDCIQEQLEKYRWLLGGLFFVSMGLLIWMYLTNHMSGIWYDLDYGMYSWTGILFLLAVFKRYINGTNPRLSYLAKNSFSLYYFHQTVLVILAFFVVPHVENAWVQMGIIMTGTFIISLMLTEICKRIRITAFLFGMK